MASLIVRGSHYIFVLVKAVPVFLKRYGKRRVMEKNPQESLWKSLLSLVLTRDCMELLPK